MEKFRFPSGQLHYQGLVARDLMKQKAVEVILMLLVNLHILEYQYKIFEWIRCELSLQI
jgi:hypothetical protein